MARRPRGRIRHRHAPARARHRARRRPHLHRHAPFRAGGGDRYADCSKSRRIPERSPGRIAVRGSTARALGRARRVGRCVGGRAPGIPRHRRFRRRSDDAGATGDRASLLACGLAPRLRRSRRADVGRGFRRRARGGRVAVVRARRLGPRHLGASPPASLPRSSPRCDRSRAPRHRRPARPPGRLRGPGSRHHVAGASYPHIVRSARDLSARGRASRALGTRALVDAGPRARSSRSSRSAVAPRRGVDRVGLRLSAAQSCGPARTPGASGVHLRRLRGTSSRRRRRRSRIVPRPSRVVGRRARAVGAREHDARWSLALRTTGEASRRRRPRHHSRFAARTRDRRDERSRRRAGDPGSPSGRTRGTRPIERARHRYVGARRGVAAGKRNRKHVSFGRDRIRGDAVTGGGVTGDGVTGDGRDPTDPRQTVPTYSGSPRASWCTTRGSSPAWWCGLPSA